MKIDRERHGIRFSLGRGSLRHSIYFNGFARAKRLKKADLE